MLNTKIMKAVGALIARQARAIVAQPQTTANEVIDLEPLLAPWKPGTAENPITYKKGDIRTYNDVAWKCVQEHTHHGEPGWEPGIAASLWAPYHGTDAAHALPWTQPTGAHDMYQIGQFMIWTDGKFYECIQATNFSPEEYPQAWKKNGETTEEPEQPVPEEPEKPVDEEWPEWYPWNHVGAIPWQQGSKCTYNGQHYISKVNNNVWQPTVSSVWEKQV